MPVSYGQQSLWVGTHTPSNAIDDDLHSQCRNMRRAHVLQPLDAPSQARVLLEISHAWRITSIARITQCLPELLPDQMEQLGLAPEQREAFPTPDPHPYHYLNTGMLCSAMQCRHPKYTYLLRQLLQTWHSACIRWEGNPIRRLPQPVRNIP